MTQHLYKLQASLQSKSGLGRDRFVNSFHLLTWPDTGVIDFPACVLAVKTFYNNSDTSPIGIGRFLSPTISQTLGTLKLYNMSNALESPPEDTAQLGPLATFGTGATPLPDEVACCLTYHGDPVYGGVKRQSWRGRIFLGPMSTAGVDNSTEMFASSRPSIEMRNQIIVAATLLHSSFLAAGVAWVIASKVQQHLYPITSFAVDDAWDTVRARGDRPTTKATSAPMDGPNAPIAWAVR